MKTTLEIDDELYREAKAVASLTGRKMKDLVTEGLRWAVRPEARGGRPPSKAIASRRLSAFFAAADDAFEAVARTPTAREQLTRDRDRLAAR